jgi:hypothetical protein
VVVLTAVARLVEGGARGRGRSPPGGAWRAETGAAGALTRERHLRYILNFVFVSRQRNAAPSTGPDGPADGAEPLLTSPPGSTAAGRWTPPIRDILERTDVR